MNLQIQPVVAADGLGAAQITALIEDLPAGDFNRVRQVVFQGKALKSALIAGGSEGVRQKCKAECVMQESPCQAHCMLNKIFPLPNLGFLGKRFS